MDKRLLDAGRSERGWHRIQNVIRCPRLFAWKEIKGLEFPISAPLVNGSLLHIALAHHYQILKETQTGGDPDQWLSPANAVLALAEKNSDKSPLWLNSVERIQDVYLAYVNNWAYEQWRVLEVEHEFRAYLGKEDHLYTQRADLVVEDPDGGVWIVDHKSAYRITSKTLRQHILDGQFIGYQLFGKAFYGPKFRGVIVNRVKLSPAYDFDRRPIEPAPLALKHFVRVIEEGESRIRKWEGKPPLDWPMALNNQTCFGKYGKCDAYELCRFGDPESKDWEGEMGLGTVRPF